MQVSTTLEYVEMVNHYEEQIGELIYENSQLSEEIESLKALIAELNKEVGV